MYDKPPERGTTSECRRTLCVFQTPELGDLTVARLARKVVNIKMLFFPHKELNYLLYTRTDAAFNL
jgi:hypothetical protein